MIDQDFASFFIILLILVLIMVASNVIPFIGFIRKRWKGLIIGCLVQPFVCLVAFLLAIGGFALFKQYDIKKNRAEAMLTIKGEDHDGGADFWYLKTNEECFCEFKVILKAEDEEKAEDDEDQSKDDEGQGKDGKDQGKEDNGQSNEKANGKDNPEYKHALMDVITLFDIVPIDSCSVCVDDKIVVTFDRKNRKVTAKEYEVPMEIVAVDWEKVDDYFKKYLAPTVRP